MRKRSKLLLSLPNGLEWDPGTRTLHLPFSATVGAADDVALLARTALVACLIASS